MNKKKFVVAAGLGLAQLALLPAVLQAQEKEPAKLDEVVVTASRTSRKQADVGRVVRVITADQLSKSQGRTLPEVLNNVAGLTLSGTNNAAGSVISVFTRGASAGNTLILIDGIPANNASYISNDYDINAFSIDQIERIEILRGVNSTLYGSDAVAGVINIITKKPSADKLNASVQATGGSYNTFKEAYGLNGSVGKTGIAVNFSNTDSKGFSSADPSGNPGFDKDDFHQQAFNIHLTQQITDKFSLSGNIQATQNRLGADASAFNDDPDHIVKNTTLFGGLTGKYAWETGALNIILNQNNVNNRFVNGPAGDGSTSSQDNTGKITYTEAIWNQKLSDNFDLTAGVNYRYAKSTQAGESASTWGVFNTYIPNAHNHIFSGYADLFLKAGGFHFDLGGRYNHHSEYGNNYTYTINPSYTIAGKFKLFASMASGYKVPSLYQLYSQYGNLDLKPEASTTYEGGIDFDMVPSKLNLSASVFKRDIKDVICYIMGKYDNGIKQKDKGLEVELTTKPIQNLDLSAWYAYVEGEGPNSSGVFVDYLSRRPKHTFGANAGYQIGKTLYINLIYKYVGSRNDAYYDNVKGPVDVNLKTYSVFDAYVQVKPLKNLTVFADVKNLFDMDYVEISGYTTKGRNFNAGIRYDIK
ncbi:TonB-dependent receptor [Pedobacter sp. BS3]|uniref:TonB-dependent receptor plug domain-containing protein n=1 Tax=Pedobacter sp. BS3 TaxID=2567937 RepID=UPI0011EFBEDC|nr:TonB-dependent receptor [Pedobacter sp. BS3]TZF84985.1 TonB-dependent receptor [Pedobacter sp. BS3]